MRPLQSLHRSRHATRALAAAALASALTTLPAAAQRADDVDALISRAAATYKAARTVSARFEQTLTNPLTGSATVSHGVLQRQAPDKFNFEFTDPEGDRLVADGTWIWVYTPSTAPKQVIKMPLAAAGGVVVDPGLQFFDAPTERFTVRDGGAVALGGERTRVLTLTPKRGAAGFTQATVWLDPDDGMLRQFETVDGMGVKRRVRLTDLKLNVPVPAASFRFTPPPGVRIVDQKALTGGR
ncbi:MAG TPA: outer membrane lipoprotein carrier protein LolA [Gemmatimonadaceae bacterium]|nr:outer membrane lipoprotein carrier protein LolA [Gemmatimonadaceae bacterium]